MHWFIDPIKNKYADFTGRATRQEFWMFTLVYVLIYAAIVIVQTVMGTQIPSFLFALAILVPGVSITARRLHDTDMSGWWQLIGLVPLVGFIVMVVLLVRDSQAGDNKYGTNPKGVAAPAAEPIADVPAVEDTEKG